jgi:hypothetical protein
MKILDKKIAKEKPRSMFNDLYQNLSDKIGEDIAFKILRLTGIVPLKFELDYWGGCGMEGNMRRLIDSYNSTPSLHYKKYKLERRIRNIIFRQNIKVYMINEVICDRKSSKPYIFIGKVYEQRPIFPNNKDLKIQILDFIKFEGCYYMVINYDFEIEKHNMNFNITRINF